jgi:tRNA (guanine9-N1)-methyltransferase
MKEFKIKADNGIRIIIDFSFDNLMQEKEVKSMINQLALSYAINKKSNKPFKLTLFSISPTFKQLLEKINFNNWIGIEYTTKDEEENSFEHYLKDLYNNSTQNKLLSYEEFKKNKCIYLTADSENTIFKLDHDINYFIGGFVDRNRHKLMTLSKANKHGLNHAKLPIGEYINLKSSKVLTVNHVFEILSSFHNQIDEKNWESAFQSILPKRKINN